MARTRRFKSKGDVAYYHVVSRTVGGKRNGDRLIKEMGTG